MEAVRIHIVGGGAIGLLLGAKLALSGAGPVIWTRTGEQCRQLREGGLELREADGTRRRTRAASFEWTGRPEAAAEAAGQALNEREPVAVALAVKQTHIDDGLAAFLREVTGSDPKRFAVFCFQNGIGHMDRLSAELPGVPLFAAVTTEAARREAESAVHHTGSGGVWIGSSRYGAKEGEDPREIGPPPQKMFAEALEQAGFSAFLSNDIHNRVCRKLLANAVINPLTAIFDVKNGELPGHPARLALMEALHQETATVLSNEGLAPSPQLWEELLDVCRRTGSNVSSMLADVRAGRQTEIDAINGAIARLAVRHGTTAPLNEAVAALVRAMRR